MSALKIVLFSLVGGFVLIILSLVAMYFLSSDFKTAFDNSFDESYVKGFKENFIPSCSNGDESKVPMCNCILDHLIKLDKVKMNPLKFDAYFKSPEGVSIISTCSTMHRTE